MSLKMLPWIVSVAIHLGLLLAGLLAPQKPEFGIEAGKNSIEVNLVAASREAVATPAAPQPPPPEPQPPQPPQPPAPKIVEHTPEHGDASSPKPGKDAVSAHSDAGAILTVKPDYLSNPSPLYPEGSRRRKEEGLVVLAVIVGPEGRAEAVSLLATSGFAELDKSASTAVSGWRFRPATMAGLKVRSRVEVPVRFRLDG